MLDLLRQLFEFILHIDKHLAEIVTNYQSWTYLILCVIIFCETGLVVTPFLPGDSLLFAAGAIAALPGNPLSPYILLGLVLIAAFFGDNTNFFIGSFLGHKVYERNYKLIRREYIDKTHQFYERHGGKTLIIARFMPIIRTFAPFVAGVGSMTYRRFLLYCIIGNILWVNTFIWSGYLFGNIPFIRKNFSLVVFVIIFVSLLPTFYAVVNQFFKKWKERKS
jgi:membrane-associated protein